MPGYMCQRPERAYFISTLVSKGGIAMKWCQRPERAYFISTENMLRSGKPRNCVNALNGLTSFLPADDQFFDEIVTECQRPERAYFISTWIHQELRQHQWRRVNALNGLTSFLHANLKTRMQK